MTILEELLDAAALRYLKLWQWYERPRHEAFQSVLTGDLVREVAAAYRVSRSFPGHANNVHKHVALLEARRHVSLSAPVALVSALADEYEQTFGRRAISAASKMLWMMHRSPTVIYDALARQQLASIGRQDDVGFRLRAGDYASYFAVWQQQYQRLAPAVVHAVERLDAGMRKHPACLEKLGLTADGMRELLDAEWFRERVFDIGLWLCDHRENQTTPKKISPPSEEGKRLAACMVRG